MGTQLRKGTRIARRGPGTLHFNVGFARSTTVRGLDELEIGTLIHALRSASTHEPRMPALLRPDLAAQLLTQGILESEKPQLRLAIHGTDLLSIALIGILGETFTLCVDPRTPQKVDIPLHLALGSDSLGVKLTRALGKALAGTNITIRSLHSPDLLICTHTRTPDPALFRSLLVQDQPYLPITTDDNGYELGPLTIPGRTACAHCLTLQRAHADPFYPSEIYAPQDHSTPTPPLAALYSAAVHAAQMIHAFACHTHTLLWCQQILRIDALGRTRSTKVAPHPQCGCGAAGIPFPLSTTEGQDPRRFS